MMYAMLGEIDSNTMHKCIKQSVHPPIEINFDEVGIVLYSLM